MGSQIMSQLPPKIMIGSRVVPLKKSSCDLFLVHLCFEPARVPFPMSLHAGTPEAGALKHQLARDLALLCLAGGEA